MKTGDLRRARRAILAWYRQCARDLPWRKTRDPYAVLVSEMMLQQQTVVRVIPVYKAFLHRFPTLEALAAASRSDVVRVWSAIGLNRQALRLHGLARAVATEGSIPPRSEARLTRFKGIGRYTAAAVMCFAHGERRAMVDTNIRRVLGRLIHADALEGEATWELAAKLLPRRCVDVYDWNQALMDLGATVCRARAPKCGECPVRNWCAALRAPVARSSRREVREERAAYVASAPARPARQPRRHVGSARWLRGQVVRALSAMPADRTLGEGELARRTEPRLTDEQLPLLREVLTALEKAGLVTALGRGRRVRYALAEG